MISWNSFSLKRNITIEKFIEIHKINSSDEFENECKRFGISPPDKNELVSFFYVIEESLTEPEQDTQVHIEQEKVQKKEKLTKKSKKNQGVEK